MRERERIHNGCAPPYYVRSFFFFSSRRRHTRLQGDWSSDVCSSDLLAIFQAELNGGLDHGLVDGLHGGRGEPVKGAVEGVVLGYTMAVEVGKAAQGIAVVDAFAQLAIVPVLDAHQDE